jgi:hypothetical protein
MVFIALAKIFIGSGVVSIIIGKRKRQWVSTCDTSASTADFDVEFMRVSNACTMF